MLEHLFEALAGREAGQDAPPVDLSLERRLEAVTALAPRTPDVTHRVTLACGMAALCLEPISKLRAGVDPL
jgi:hypothetical protein